jgi:hypothetical protein
MADVEESLMASTVCRSSRHSLKTDVGKLKTLRLTTDTKIALTEKYAKQLWAVGGASAIALWQHLPQLLKLAEGR